MHRSKPDDPILAPPPVPLALRNKKGELYQRLPAVDEQLDDLLALPTHHALEARVAQTDRAQEGRVREEAAAYFLREWHRARRLGARDWLVDNMLNRVDGFIDAHLHGLDDINRENAHQDVVAGIFQQMLDLAVPRGEYFQVRFWQALGRRCNDRYCHYQRRQDTGHISTGDDDRAFDIPDTKTHVEDEVVDRVVLQRAVQGLRDRVTPDQLEAYILRKEGWPIEGERGPTLSERYGKTPRTINNWIRTVDTAAGTLREGRT